MSTTAEIVKETASPEVEELSEPVIIGVEAYISADYARAERDKLWRKVWLQTGRVEELPNVGDYITYEILDDSILIVRAAEDKIRAYHNVCAHRGRRLVDTPKNAKHARGRALPVHEAGDRQFTCNYHGWRYNLEGKSTRVLHKEDWKGALKSECSGLQEVNLDTWGGWIWINMDPKCEPLRQWLEPAATMLDPFQLQNMRYRWRKWGIFDCNWKVALEAFCEAYHIQTTHPEFNKFGDFRSWARVQGKHSNIGYAAPKNMDDNQQAKLRVGTGDARLSTAELQTYTWEKANTNTTKTLVDAAQRLKDELPPGTPASEVLQHWLAAARRDDEARGVIWPTVDAAHTGKSGTAWQIFPNFQIGHSVNNMLCYSARPYGYDPDKCVFEAAVYQLFPKGQEPETEWTYSEPTEEAWCYVLSQDFSNMAAVQQGMKSLGFSGTKPNPYAERSVANLHRNLARYMGSGAPRELK
jgi:phenylpropionate dioxygenase-like ring-hydroxylating dioxygenase large terminal subunit